jgi:hypothetical protein
LVSRADAHLQRVEEGEDTAAASSPDLDLDCDLFGDADAASVARVATPPAPESDGEARSSRSDPDSDGDQQHRAILDWRMRRRMSDSAAAAADDDSDDDADSAAAAEEQPSPRQVPRPVRGAPSSSRTLDVKPFARASAFPPLLRVMCGKTVAERVELVLCGDLVRHIGSPLFTFRVRVHAVAPEGPHFVEAVDGVLKGPCVTAEKTAKERAGLLPRSGGGGGTAVPLVTWAAIRGALSSSGYFKSSNMSVDARKAFLTSLGKRVARAMPAQSVFVTAAALAQVASVDGDDELAWALRNVLMPARFFQRMNVVGGTAARRLSADGDGAVWGLIAGNAPESGAGGGGDDDDDERAIAGAEVIRVLEQVHFAERLSEWRSSRLHAAMRLTGGGVADSVELIQRAADVFHRLPQRGAASRARGGVVWGDQGEQWPPTMRAVLARHGVFTEQRDGARWLACWQGESEFYAAATAIARREGVTFLRAETDDDVDSTLDTGFAARIQGIVANEVSTNLLLVTVSEPRARFMRVHMRLDTWMPPVMCAAASSPQQGGGGGGGGTGARKTVIIDRAHQLADNELLRLLALFATNDAKHVYVCGSTSAAPERGATTMFAHLYAQALPAAREVCTAVLTPDKVVAAGRCPLANAQAVRGGVAIFAIPPSSAAVQGRCAATAALQSVARAFPRAVVTTPYAHAVRTAWALVPAAIVILTSEWTRDDLAVVWQCTPKLRDTIWFVNASAGVDWRTVAQGPSRKRATVTGSRI